MSCGRGGISNVASTKVALVAGVLESHSGSSICGLLSMIFLVAV